MMVSPVLERASANPIILYHKEISQPQRSVPKHYCYWHRDTRSIVADWQVFVARRRRKILMFLYYFSFQKCVFKGMRASQKSEFSTKNCLWRVGKFSELNSEIFALKFLAGKFQSLNSEIFRNSTLKFQSLTLKKKGLVGTS